MANTITISKEEYEDLLKCKKLVNEDPEEELSEEELKKVEEAKKGKFVSKEGYLKQRR